MKEGRVVTMRIFGLEITRYKKKEYEEAERFKHTVESIRYTLNETHKGIIGIRQHVAELDYVALINNQLIYLNKLCLLYGDSKFHSPSAYLTMLSNIKECPKIITDLTDTMLKAKMFDETVELKSQELGIPPNKLITENDLQSFISDIYSLLNRNVEKLKIVITNISSAISNDIVKIDHDVDLVYDYNKKSKLKDDNKDVASFNISFKTIPKEELSTKDGDKTKKNS